MKTVLAASDLSSEWMRPDVGVVGVEILSTTRLGGVSSGCYEGLNLGDHVLDDHVRDEHVLDEHILDSGPRFWVSPTN